MVPVGAYVVVPVYFGDHPRSMILDTGSTSNALFKAALAEEGLHEIGPAYTIMQGATGVVRGGFAEIPALKFAGVRLTNVTMPVIDRPAPRFDVLPVAGLLGTPFLGVFDVELDFPGQRLSLYGKAVCHDVAPPWTGPRSELPVTALSNNLKLRTQDVASSANITVNASTRANQARLLLDVEVNGHPERALLDTGATTILTPEAAAEAGIAQDPSPRITSIGGIDGGHIEGDERRAAELRLGGEVDRDVRVGVFPVLNANADMVLGLDSLRHRRMWISFAEKRIFVQPSDSVP